MHSVKQNYEVAKHQTDYQAAPIKSSSTKQALSQNKIYVECTFQK
jgi:hypothetical protein